MRRFFVDIISDSPVILGSDAHHIGYVLRMKPKESIIVFDGKGNQYKAEIKKISPGRVLTEIIGSLDKDAESLISITLAQGYLKEKKLDYTIPHITELGITRWLPFFAERSIPEPLEPNSGPNKKLVARCARWGKIAAESVKQCGRSIVPSIEYALSFDNMLEKSITNDLKLVFWEEEKKLLGKDIIEQSKKVKSVFIIVGPEGGLTASEIQKAKALGFKTASLGPRILRANTAAIAACALIQYLFGDMGGL